MSPRTLLCLVTMALASLSSGASANSSVYTSTKLDGCEDLIKNPDELDISLGNLSYKCAGHKGYAFWFDESDLRQSTHFGYLSNEIQEGAGESFEIFNHIGENIEWRLDDKGTPRATIVRYFLENRNPATDELDSALYGQVLVISRVGQPDDMTGCVTAYVDALANRDATALARKLADEQAPTFPCGREKPVFHGKIGDRISEPAYNFPDLSGTD